MVKLYEVEDVVEKKTENNITMYLVKWKGFSDVDNTWEPLEGLKHCLGFLSKFSGNVSEDDENSKKTPLKSPKQDKKIKKSPKKLQVSKKEPKAAKKPATQKPQTIKPTLSKGSFETDEVERIISCQKFNDQLIFEIKWKVRKDGSQGQNSFYPNEICRKQIPQIIIDYYQARITFKNQIG